jgi:DNA-binding transcriptional MocR family regulator
MIVPRLDLSYRSDRFVFQSPSPDNQTRALRRSPLYSGGRTITNRLRTIQIQWTIDPANYRKHLEKRRSRLRKTRGEVVKNSESSGLELYREEEDGLFIWARRDPSENATSLAAAAAKQGIVPASGALFRPYQEVSP